MSSTPRIHALRQREIELIALNQKLLDSLPPGKDLAPAQATQFEATRVLIAKNKAAIIEREVEMNRERNAGGGFEVRGDGDGAFGAPSSSRGAGRPRPGNTKYADLFGLTSLSSGGFSSSQEFCAAVHRSREITDPRLLASFQAAGSSQREASPSQGGFAVPEEYSARVFDLALEGEVVRPRALILAMQSKTIKYPGVDGFVHTGGVLEGGISAAWQNELDPLSLQNMKLRLIELNTNALKILLQSSNELMEDGVPDFGNLLDSKLVSAMGFFLDSAFLFGTGTGQPRGVLNDPALIQVAIESGQTLANGPLLYQNICKMFSRLAPACRKNACWVFNSDLIPALLEMVIIISNRANTENVGGSSTPVLTKGPNGEFELLTLPVVFSEKMSALGTVGDVLLADFSQYLIGIRLGIQLMRSQHAGFTTDSTYFRGVIRVDGQGLWSKPLTPVNGQTLSWCVTLGTRS